MEENRSEYSLQLVFNGRVIHRVVIDQHYREHHSESMNDSLILELVKTLDGGNYPMDIEDEGFQYFTVEPVIFEEKPYRVILVLCIGDDFLGVVNAFRVNI